MGPASRSKIAGHASEVASRSSSERPARDLFGRISQYGPRLGLLDRQLGMSKRNACSQLRVGQLHTGSQLVRERRHDAGPETRSEARRILRHADAIVADCKGPLGARER